MKKLIILVLGGVLAVAIAMILIMNQGAEQSGENTETSSTQSNKKAFEKPESQEDEVATKTERPLVANESIKVITSTGNDEKAKEMLSNWQDSMSKTNQTKADRLIAKLVKDLNLSPEQQKELEEYFAEQVKLAGGLLGGKAPLEAAQAVAALEGKGLDELMSDVLTPEQEELWNEKEEKRAHRTADAAALKELADISSALDVREDQRTAVYDYFYEKNLEAEDSTQNPIGSALGSLTSGLGVQVDTSQLFGNGFQEAVTSAAADGGEVDFRAVMQQQREKQIVSEVQELAPILDEGQLQDYREHLQSQGSLLDGLIGG